jgi:hypothetical protein
MTRLSCALVLSVFAGLGSAAHADTLHNKTITGVFVNQGSLIAFKYQPVEGVSNPNNCDVSYLQLNGSAPFFKEQYGMLLSAIATGKPVDINTGTACGINLIVDWLFIHE